MVLWGRQPPPKHTDLPRKLLENCEKRGLNCEITLCSARSEEQSFGCIVFLKLHVRNIYAPGNLIVNRFEDSPFVGNYSRAFRALFSMVCHFSWVFFPRGAVGSQGSQAISVAVRGPGSEDPCTWLSSAIYNIHIHVYNHDPLLSFWSFGFLMCKIS